MTLVEPATMPGDAGLGDVSFGKADRWKEDFTVARVPKYRSDLAFAAGFAALVLIFSRFTFIPWLFEHQSKHIYDVSRPDDAAAAFWFLLTLPLPGLPAPVALLLGIAAWLDLSLHPDKSGKGPATIGITIGFLGTIILLFEIHQVTQSLWSLSQP